MAKAIPKFTYTGTYLTHADSSYWYIFLTSSGKLSLNLGKKSLDVILIGGGGSGQNGNGTQRRGGGSGYNVKKTGFALAAGEYDVTIGSGASQGSNADGEATMAFGLTANGGQAGVNGGAGTAQGGDSTQYGSTKGGDGFQLFDNATIGYVCGAGGGGQDTTKDISARSGGIGGGGRGGYGGQAGIDGLPNTGAGGGGGGYNGTRGAGGAGGSGLIVIRGSEDDVMPLFFNNARLDELFFNGTKVTSLVYNGTKLF